MNYRLWMFVSVCIVSRDFLASNSNAANESDAALYHCIRMKLKQENCSCLPFRESVSQAERDFVESYIAMKADDFALLQRINQWRLGVPCDPSNRQMLQDVARRYPIIGLAAHRRNPLGNSAATISSDDSGGQYSVASSRELARRRLGIEDRPSNPLALPAVDVVTDNHSEASTMSAAFSDDQEHHSSPPDRPLQPFDNSRIIDWLNEVQ